MTHRSKELPQSITHYFSEGVSVVFGTDDLAAWAATLERRRN